MLEIQRACLICNPILVCLGHNFIHITGNHDSLFLMPSMFLESWAIPSASYPEGKLGIGVCDDIYWWWRSGLGLRSEGRLPLYYWEKIYFFPSSHSFFFFPNENRALKHGGRHKLPTPRVTPCWPMGAPFRSRGGCCGTSASGRELQCCVQCLSQLLKFTEGKIQK